MNNLKAKLKKEGGFTLVEMLIVVAIIAILIAISIPMVNKALEKARHAVDQANIRDAIGLANIELLTENPPTSNEKEYKYVVTDADHQGELTITGTGVKPQCKCNDFNDELKVTVNWTTFKVTVNWATDNTSAIVGATKKNDSYASPAGE